MEETMLLRNVTMFYPVSEGEIVEYRLDGPSALIFRTKDGKIYLYDDFDQSLMELPEDSNRLTDDECRSEFARRLRRVMLVRGVSQSELASRTGISYVMLSRYMTGKSEPGFCNVDRIAKALNCSLDEFSYRY